MSQVLFPLKPDRSDRETAGDPSQITSTGDWRVDHMTLQSRCVCACVRLCACVRACEREREKYFLFISCWVEEFFPGFHIFENKFKGNPVTLDNLSHFC